MKLWLLTWKGELQAADELWRSWAPMMKVQTEIEVQSRLGVSRVEAELALAQGDPERAWRAVSVLLRDHRTMRGYDLPLLADAARALALLRALASHGGTAHGGTADGGTAERVDHIDLGSAESALRQVLHTASGWPTEPVWAPLFEAELASDGRDAGAWRRAVEASESPLAPAHLGPYTRYRLAQALVATDRQAAQHEAETARELAQKLGAGLILGWLDEFEQRAGIDPASPRESSGSSRAARVSELTERERQVLELIAQGLSNKQIGERLYISTKTASVHVSAILRKLGATSRTEAVYLAGAERASV
jgi:DNA-binding CsgD family transcriptional regulator